MTRTIIVIAAALLAVLPAMSAQAQSPRTFVSAAGSDSNPCSFAAPCRHFQAAVNATSLGGEVDALDPAGYGPITITQAITIEGQGWSYIAPPASGNGITINAVSGNVSIRGVSLNGVGITGATNGIVFNSGTTLNVQNCVIRNFSRTGIDFLSSTDSTLSISDTQVADVGLDGIRMEGMGIATGTLDRVSVQNATQQGVQFVTLGAALTVTVSDSNFSNDRVGVAVVSLSGNQIKVMLRNVVVSNNSAIGIDVSNDSGTGAVARVTGSTITGNGSGFVTVGSGSQIISFGDNAIDGNTANGVPTSTIALK
jgi:hypothetical protein